MADDKLAPRPQGAIATMKRLLAEDAYKRRFEEILRDRAPQFMASITNLMTGSYQLQKCKPESVIASAFIAATLDLPIDKNLGYAWIIPYGEMAQFQIGWKGYVQLAIRSGCYSGMNAAPLNQEALGWFDPNRQKVMLYDAIGDPVINFDMMDKTKPAVGYFCGWKLTTGFVKLCYWTKEEVEAHAKRYSQAYKQGKKDSPWFNEFDKMAVKTVVSNSLRRWGIMSVETRALQTALRYDQGAQEYIDSPIVYPDGEGEGEGAEGEGQAETEAPTNGKEAGDAAAARLAPTPPLPEQPKEERDGSDLGAPTGERGTMLDLWNARTEGLKSDELKKQKDKLEIHTGAKSIEKVKDEKVAAAIEWLRRA